MSVHRSERRGSRHSPDDALPINGDRLGSYDCPPPPRRSGVILVAILGDVETMRWYPELYSRVGVVEWIARNMKG